MNTSELDSTTLVTAVVAAATALLVTYIAAWLGYRQYRKQKTHREAGLVSALFGELANMLEHYTYAEVELPRDPADTAELKKRLLWSKFGALTCAQNFTQFGFLAARDIRLLLQINLRVRNTDTLCDHFLDQLSNTSSGDLEGLRNRMRYVVESTQELMRSVADQSEDLEGIYSEVRKDMPGLTGS